MKSCDIVTNLDAVADIIAALNDLDTRQALKILSEAHFDPVVRIKITNLLYRLDQLPLVPVQGQCNEKLAEVMGE